MIDIHAHILPGIDDGPGDWEDSVRLARMAVENGITKLVATPHYQFRNRLNGLKEVKAKVEAFRDILDEQGVSLSIFPGNEVFINSCQSESLKKWDFVSLNETGRYALIEMPMEDIPESITEVIFSFVVKGITPIIAHPERNRQVKAEPNWIIEAIGSGALIQVNACSLVGRNGSDTRRTAEILIANNMAHFLASDMHCPRNRVPLLKVAHQKAQKLIGKEGANKLVQSNPQKVLSGVGMTIEPPERYRRFFSLFRKLAKACY